jgi:pyruvate,water dikinase
VRTATKVYVNLAEPFLASRIAKENVDGVGLLRAEFMIANIGIHPQKLIQEGKQELFIKKLTKDIVKFCKPFSPRPVVYRATDFKTNEYRNLQGGGRFEPKEENPLLGFRGAFRYISTPQVFELELEVIKRVRNKMGLKNLWLMIPFVRTPRELLEVKRVISSAGLARSPSFKLWMMVEIPSNVILLKEFIKVGIDGISIGSNDLTMLTLGLDRDNDEIAGEFDERNKAVLWMIRRTIKTANHYGITSSICGQAPSNYPDLVEKLVRWGITSISVNPDMIESTRDTIHWAEKRVMKGAR